jgi:hypothetical protein
MDNEDFFILPNDIFQTKIQQKAINLAINYNQDSINSIINVFVDGVKPLWEDPACKEGGRFNIRLPKSHTSKYWEDLLMAMIGE